MAIGMLRRRRRSFGSGAVTAATGVAAGGALIYLLAVSRRGEAILARARRVLREAADEVEGRARDIRHRAGEAVRRARKAAQAGSDELAERARELGGKARRAAEEARAAAREAARSAQERGVPPERLASGAAGGVLLARAVLGRGLVRIPAALGGLSLLSRAASGSATVQRALRRTAEMARAAAARLRSVGAGRGGRGQRGAEGPEVREVKSPAELEQGIASARPEPTYRDRADRSGPHMGGREAARGEGEGTRERPEDEPAIFPPSTDDVGPRADFDAPEPGSDVHEEELGVILPHEGGSSAGERDEAAPRISGAGEEPPARRSDAAAEDATRREPTGDGS